MKRKLSFYLFSLFQRQSLDYKEILIRLKQCYRTNELLVFVCKGTCYDPFFAPYQSNISHQTI